MIEASITPEQQAQTWLRRISKEMLSGQARVLLVRLFQLVAQISVFWFFAKTTHWVIVEQQNVLPEQLVPLACAALIWISLIWLADNLQSHSKYKIETELENRVHRVFKNKHIAITRQHSATYWQQLLLNNISDIGNYLIQYSVQKWLSAIAPLVALLVIFPINYVVAIILCVTMPLIPVFMVLVGKGAAALHRKHFIALERLGDMFSDRLKALTLITTSGQHQDQLKRLNDASNIVNRKTMSVVSIAFLSTTVLDFFATIAMALVAVFIGFSMLGEINIGPEISLEQGLFMLLTAPLLFSELRALGRFYHQKAKAEASAERFALLLDEYELLNNKAAFTGLAWLNFHVTTPNLHANKLTLEPGDWVSLQGNSGQGKTVLLEALMGFRASSHQLSADLALLSQQTAVLDKSVAFNLHLGDLSVTEHDMVNALQEVGLIDWLNNLSNGLATELGDCPALSGGEAQRLALARVLLKPKDVVLLDEPTAHLTIEQHQEIADLIHQKLQHKTVVWASHKTLPDTWFNRIWKVSHGEIKETP
ncbi:ABC transporter ATP-binding protein/permease [Paraglaciecola marina]|uniref:ABC transporter ATP-binding protein/permease n=1 Tax=Paraglaciecola marina TaxID=2500157 RepID=UPI00105E2413|nr:ATP-binding cassette domain-containing protein [Paraglaciecola marina]